MMPKPEYEECGVCEMPYEVGHPHRSEKDCMDMIAEAESALKEARERVRSFYTSAS